MREAEGARYTGRDGGHIHELIPGTFIEKGTGALLGPSDHPVIVVEGQTDVAAAMDLGFVAVGRPSATGGLKGLADLLRGRDVAIFGENDRKADGKWPGRDGVERAFQALRGSASSCKKCFPPEDCKDLRDWVQKYAPDQQEVLAAIEGGEDTSDSDVLEDCSPLALAELWLQREHYLDGVPTLRRYRGVWYRFDGKCYREIEADAEIRGRLYAFLEGKKRKKFGRGGEPVLEPYEATRSRVSDIVDALNRSCPVDEDPPCWLDGRKSPPTDSLICFRNGVLDVDSYLAGQTILAPPSPVLFSLTAVPYEFNPGAICPRWLKFLGEIFQHDQERVNLLQEWFGYNLVVDTSLEKFLLMVGRPGSGKSTTLEVLQAVLGAEQCATSSFKHLCDDFGLEPLMGKTSVILPDAHIPRRVDSTQALEVIKSIVGRDTVTINRKHIRQLAGCRLHCRFTVAVNELPELPDHARALERRLCLLHFPQSFEGKEDRSLKDKLPKESPGIALWALEGLKRLRYNGAFTQPSSSVPVIDEFRRFITPIAEFLQDCCDIEGTAWAAKNQMFDAWVQWAHEHGLPPGARSRFGQRLLAQVPTCVTARRCAGGRQFRVYQGVGLKPSAVDRYLVNRRR